MQDRLKPTTLRYSWVCCKQSLISIRGIYIYIYILYLYILSYFNLLLHTVKYKTVGRNLMFQSEHWKYNFGLSINIYWKENTCTWAVHDALLEQGMKLLRNYFSLPKELSPWWFVGRFWWIPSAWPSSWGRTRSSRLASRLRGCYSSVSVNFLSRIIEHVSCFTIE